MKIIATLAALAVAGAALAQGAPPPRGPKPGGPPPAASARNAVNNFGRAADNREGALDSYTNYSTNDVPAKLSILQQEIYVNQQKLIQTLFNQENGDAVEMRFVFYPSDKGEIIPGYTFRPKTMVAGKRYPALVMVHGGFHERFSQEWFKLVRSAVDRGYVVVFPEYRGSRGYTEDYYTNDYGTTDVVDTVAMAKWAQTQAWVDPARLGIVGISRGGMVTLLSIQQNQQLFKAAVDIVGLTDFVAYMSYKPDYRRREIADENAGFGGRTPDKNLPAYIAVSPINFVDKIVTPLLILNTTGDKIAPFSLHGGRLIEVLKGTNKVWDYHVYDNAPGGHSFMNAETPEAADGLTRTFAWLDKYLTPGAGR